MSEDNDSQIQKNFTKDDSKSPISPLNEEILSNELLHKFKHESKEKPKQPKKKKTGCSHYKRNCEVLAPCCNQWFTCRRCHDDIQNDIKIVPDVLKHHKINRYKIEKIRCFTCKEVQQVSSKCIKCEEKFSEYFCGICKFFCDLEKSPIFHCKKCNICRVGKAEDHTHCDVCCCCLHNDYYKSHKCFKSCYKNDCPVCYENLFSSTSQLYASKCGHHLHMACLEKMIKNGMYKCPLCSKMMVDDSKEREIRENAVKRIEMPKELKKKVKMLCNECSEKFEGNFHFYGVQCVNEKCKSFNTKMIQ